MELEGCTFQPKLISSPGRDDVGRTVQRKGPVVDRLYRLAGEAKVKRAKAQKQRERDEAESCTFKPQIISKSRNPAVQATYDSARPRSAMVANHIPTSARKRHDEVPSDLQKCTFQPATNSIPFKSAAVD
ncbi:hypothetical protein KIPB_015796, partial [Kipferlia bialata]|eukprot:g15796.t1